MSVAEVTGRIAQIQSRLAQLRTPTTGSQQSAAAAFSAVLGAEQVLADGYGGGASSDIPGISAGAGTSADLGLAAGAQGVLPVNRQGALASLPSSTTGPASANPGGAAVVAEARRYLGVPYLWGGTDPSQGLDCSGLVQLVYRNLGIDLPRVSYQQATAGRPVPSLAEARPGDILAFDSPVDHVGIYIGDGKMIEAPRTGLDVRVVDVYETPTAIRRVLPDEPVPGGARVGAPSTVASSALAGTPYGNLFVDAGRRHGVAPTLLAAVARQESAFDPRAVSPAGAQGLGVANPFDPAQAVDGAARLLRDLLGEFGGRVDLALAAYNAGPGAVKRYGGIPPYPETQKYVPAVLAHQSNLERS